MIENSIKKIKNFKDKIYIILFCITSMLFALPSIIYIVKNKSIYQFIWGWTYFLKRPETKNETMLNAILFFIMFSLLFLLYIIIIKKRKEIFKNKKQIFMLTTIVSIIFLTIIPYTSTDVYSYIANGWSGAHYKENPYYVSTGEIVDTKQINEPMFNKVANCWRYETVVYGPLWTLICTILSGLSFGNIDIALFIFKLANLIVHIASCILIYKITKKDLYVILYGLNPFILFEALSNVHNDIFIILFILLAIYFLIKKKNLFISVAFIAMATAIKYLAILILPFIVIYHAKDRDIKERIKLCIYCGIEYIAIIGLFYVIYLKDLQVLSGLFIQQGKYNRSIFFLLYYYLRDEHMNIVTTVQNITFVSFAIYYVYIVIKLLLKKEISFNKIIKRYNLILVIFTFIIITNFNPWYIMWLFPTIFWIKPKYIKTILVLSYASQIGNILNFATYSEVEALGIPYFTIMIIITIMLSPKKISERRIRKEK